VNTWFRLLRHHKGLRDRVRFSVRYFSQILVLRPLDYFVHGRVEAELLPALLDRLRWFYGQQRGAQFVMRTAAGWQCYTVADGAIEPRGRAARWRVWCAAALGKVLLLEHGGRWPRLEALLCNKFFIINWTGEFRTSSWRFAASLAERPFRRFGDSMNRAEARPRSDAVVVVGNGPSATNIFEAQFAGMDTIVCNTAVKSRRLLAERNVVALCFIDAAFFIGPSAYTQAFFRELNRALSERDFSLYIDCEHESVVRSKVPALRDERCFPVFLDAAVSLQASFANGRLQTTSNSVFTTLMLPLAATYYRRIHLVGFDGKAPAMTNYFWKHSDEFQFTDLLSTVQATDPGFFSKRDYVDYSRRNEEEIAALLAAVEQRGIDVVMTHRSYIEPLQRRFVARQPAASAGAAC
jgi:hypothetical protein